MAVKGKLIWLGKPVPLPSPCRARARRKHRKEIWGPPPPACPAADHLVLRSVPGHHAAQVGADGVDACGMCGNTKQCLCCFLRGGMLARLLAAAIRSRHDCIRHSGCVPYFSRPISPTTRYVGSPCIRHRQRQCNALGHDTGAAGALVVSSGG